MNDSVKSKYDSAVDEATNVVIDCLVNEQPLTEEFIVDNYVATLNKYGVYSKKNYDLISLLQSVVLKIQQTHFLTINQKQAYREKVNETMGKIKEPFVDSFDKVEELIGEIEDLKIKFNEIIENQDQDYVISKLNYFQQKIKQIKISKNTYSKGKKYGRFIVRTFSSGIIFLIFFLLVSFVILYSKNPNLPNFLWKVITSSSEVTTELLDLVKDNFHHF